LAKSKPSATANTELMAPIQTKAVMPARNSTDLRRQPTISNINATQSKLMGKWTTKGCNRPKNCQSQKISVVSCTVFNKNKGGKIWLRKYLS
jgi:hypothetical protein